MGRQERVHTGEQAVIFRPFYYYDLGCASYLLGCGTVGTCAVVDPRADDVDSYVAFAEASPNPPLSSLFDHITKEPARA